MQIRPFKAFRFNEKVVGDAGKCIGPPYDVISPAMQEALYEKSQYNVVRIIRGKTEASDDASNNQYTRAADYFNTWIQQEVLKQDSDEAIYGYVQDFEVGGINFQRLSFIALGELEAFGGTVSPHEKTLDGPKADRLNLQKACGATLGLIFMLYKDEQKIADKIVESTAGQKPLIDLSDELGVRHRLFAITDGDGIKQITAMMGGKSCIIADGHHRYETALNYYNETKNPAAKYLMLAFANTSSEGLIVLATHRVIENLEFVIPSSRKSM